MLNGSLLYAADGRGVSVYDVTNAGSIRKIDLDAGDAESADVALLGDDDLLLATTAGIDHFRVNDDGTIERGSSIEITGGVSHVAASAEGAAATAGRELLILQPAANGLSIEHRRQFTRDIRALEVSGDVAFVAVSRTAIYAIDMNSGATLSTIGVDAVDLSASATTLWAAAESRGLYGIDLSTHAIVSKSGEGTFVFSAVAAHGTRVYAVEAPDRAYFFDASDPSKPVFAGTVIDWVDVIAASGSRVFLAGPLVDSEGLTFETGAPVRIFEVSNAGVAVKAGEYRDLAGPISGVWTDGSVAYVIDPPYLRVLDVSKTTEPKELASILVPDIQDHIRVKNGLAVNYGRLYVVLIDVSKPRSPRLIGKWHTRGHAPSFAAIARDTVIEANEHSGLHVVDYSDPANLVQIAGRIMHYHSVVAGDDAIYALQAGVLITLDITDRRKVVDRTILTGQYMQIESIPPNAAFPHHLVVRAPTGVTLFSVGEDRFRPVEIGFVPFVESELMATGEDVVYLTRDGRLHRMDFPGGSGFVETDMPVTSPMQISVAGEKVVVADRYRLRVFGPDTPPPPPASTRRRAVGR